MDVANKDDTIYVAGFFDGEGSATIRGMRHGSRVQHDLLVIITNTDRAVLDWVAQHFGGRVSGRVRLPPHRPVWSWQITQRQAIAFLLAIRPYLRVKHRQAWLALEFMAQATWRYGQHLSPEELALREGYRLALVHLNGRHRV